MSSHPHEQRRDSDTGTDPCRWGVYIYLCRRIPRFRATAGEEWKAITSLSVPPSVSVAIQQDTYQRARRWRAGAGRSPSAEPDGPRDRKCINVARNFLTWAATRAPSQHSALVLGGTGVLDPWSAVGADGDPTRTFAICDDAVNNDAIEVSELRTLLQDYKETAGRPLDVLILDMSAMQWVEVAYQLQDLVRYSVGAQAPVAPGPCPVGQLVGAFANEDATTEDAVADLARRAAAALSDDYRGRTLQRPRGRTVAVAPTTVSALRLSALEPVARAFDTFSHALMLALGEEVVWQAREAIAQNARERPFDPTAEHDQWTSPFFEQYAYDFVGLMKHAAAGFARARRGAVSRTVATFLSRLDDRTLVAELNAIDERVNRTNVGEQPGKGPREFVALLEAWRPAVTSPRMKPRQTAQLKDSLSELAKQTTLDGDEFWVAWARDDADRPSDRLRREIEIANEGRQHARRLESLATRVGRMLDNTRPRRSADDELIVARFPNDSPASGLSLYRPTQLDTLLNANYLQLEFNRRSHWTALLAVINLVARHARAMWRVIESVLSTAPLDAREALLQRVFGPTSVVTGFREQLKVLRSPPLSTLSISDRGTTAPNRGPNGHYVVRYTPCEPLAAIGQQLTGITVEELTKRLATLDDLFQGGALKRAQLKALRVFGATLGQDVIRDLKNDLDSDRRSTGDNTMHLQLQLPRELMRFPWELMHGPEREPLADHYALARQVYVPEGLVRARPRLRSSKLRPLVIAAPVTEGPEPVLRAAHTEGERVAEEFESLRNELGEVIDFDREQDTWIGKRLTVMDLRDLLSSGHYDIVHFTGHGLFKENDPDRSGWLLSDGVLDVDAIRNSLNWSPKPPWLVYANACQSAAENPTYQGDLHGLASAFITSGVAAYIGALWKVEELAGYAMAVKFYRQLCLERATLGQALLAARQHVRPGLAPATEANDAELEMDALQALTGYSFVLFGDPTTRALEQVGTEPPDGRPAGVR